MHVITKTPFTQAAKKYPNDAQNILDVYAKLNRGYFQDIHELQKLFPSTERYKYQADWYTINIAGNNIRLIACIFFKTQKLFVKHIVNHTKYDKLNQKYRNEG